MSLHIITYANHTNNPGYDNFVNSMLQNKLSYKIIGTGDIWKGFHTKMNSCLKEIETYSDNDIVCIIDCFDVIACNGPTKLVLSRFLSYNKPIVFGVESRFFMISSNGIKLTKWCNNNNSLYGRNHDICSLNGGTLIGYVNAVKHMIKYAIDNGFTDDQLAYHHYAEEYPGNLGLDLSSSIFGNYSFLDLFRFREHRGKIIDTTSLCHPCFVHIPGTSGDFNYRMNYIGNCILKSKYKKMPFTEILRIAWNKIRSPSNRKAVLFTVSNFLIILLMIYKLLCKRKVTDNK